MIDGQHTGRLSDSIEGEEGAYARMKRIAKPTGKAYRRQPGDHDLGDGDRCPLVPDHGRMYAYKDAGRQWCPHSDHAGTPGKGENARPATRSWWPLADGAFETAVKEHQNA